MLTRLKSESISLLLTLLTILLALVIAWFQLRAARADARRQGARLQKIIDALSTRFLGEFPNYVEALTPFVDSAAHSIDILVLQVSTASISHHTAWLSYKHVLAKKIVDGIRTSIFTVGDDQASRSLQLQFETPMKTADSWATFLREKAYGLEKILLSMGSSNDPKALTRQQVIAILSAMRRKALDEWFRGAEIRVITEGISLNIWMVDDKKAIFAISSGADTYFRYGFETEDRGLVSAFVTLIASYRQQYPNLHTISRAEDSHESHS